LSVKKWTVSCVSEFSLTQQKSKFTAILFPCADEDVFKSNLNHIKALHAKAEHACYAYQVGNPIKTRANDDGEPSGSAGLPILGQLKSHELINVGCVVIRYYGGTKLGVPGLIAAYKNTCLGAIRENKMIPYQAFQTLQIVGNYVSLMKFMSVANQQNWHIRYLNSESEPMLQIHIEEESVPLVMDKLSLFSSLTCF
jgi:uncharacterized YigZ family protein